MSAELEYYHELTQALQHAYDTRYLTGELTRPLFSPHVSLNASPNHICVAVGFVVLFYDHLLTIDEEIRLVWHALNVSKWPILSIRRRAGDRHSAIARLLLVPQSTHLHQAPRMYRRSTRVEGMTWRDVSPFL